MSATFTPGPWHLSEDHKTRRVIRGSGSKPRTVCIIEDWTTDPDAGLIAAAPDLYEALRDLIEELDDNTDLAGDDRNTCHTIRSSAEALAVARTALAKADGAA